VNAVRSDLLTDVEHLTAAVAFPQLLTAHNGRDVVALGRVFPGKLWTQDNSAAARWPKLNRMKGVNREGLGKNMIHINGNSGVQALNLAYLFGSRRIILLGFDMKLGPNGERHHHADHPAPMVQNQTFEEWLHKLNKVARDLEVEKCEVLNATPGSAMQCFPVVDWKEVLK